VDHSVPRVACVVDDDMDLAVAKLGGLLDKFIDVFVAQHVPWNCQRASAILLDRLGDVLCLLC